MSFLSLFLASTVVVNLTSDHPDAFYKLGELCVFEVTGLVDTNGTLAAEGGYDYLIDDGGDNVLARGHVDFAAANPVKIVYPIERPGFARLRILNAYKFDRFGLPVQRARDWSVGCEADGIEKGSPSPADFDEFWAQAKAECAKIPLDPEMIKSESLCTADWDVYAVSFATVGKNKRVYGVMSVPKGEKGKKYPLSVEVPGAGFGDFSQFIKPKKDRIVLFMGVFPWTPGRGVNKLDQKSNFDNLQAACKAYYGGKAGDMTYPVNRLDENREDYYFYPYILGIERAVEWAASRPDVDQENIWYKGTSQGGYFGIVLTALNRRFTRAAFFVPAGTDMLGCLKGRASGWPRPMQSFAFDPEKQAKAVANAPYFDAANFASRITCPCTFVVGLADECCPPSCVYATYNEVKAADKEILPCPGMTHSVSGDVYKRVGAWLRTGDRAKIHE